ncbi:XRE family transcriptional regulator [Latilactobacillus curvatus]|uniref:helix-turn-helix domain-containing protein n=1 Tax=Latilactobacillus curvatus TaxID=28038 RepID=UPI000F7CF842|nr:helix-turn-helix transcriptional regulator [Latilactobacillus curvatus]AZP96502.1 XRE family transcriptional regulator [Latilactobacillus curvatus]
MRILGDKLKQIRKARGMSQAELAKGICTQATISLIEKKEQVPSTKILLEICKRLEITLDSVIVQEDDQLHVLLSRVQALLFTNEFKKARDLIQQIYTDQLVKADDYKRYYYFQGQIKLLLENKPDDALFFFNRAFNQYVVSQTDVYGILCIIGISKSYLMKGALERVRIYAEQAVEMLENSDPLAMADFQVELQIYNHLAGILFELKDYEGALKYAQLAIDEAIDKQSLYLLDALYFILGRAEYALHRENALQDLTVAKTLALIRHHPEIIVQVDQQWAE